MLDVIISGGTVVNGLGTPGFRADIGIEGGQISCVGDLAEATARRVVDATGLTVCPGFIDSHTHSDAALLNDPQHSSGLRQGITTEILGQDGLSYAPMSAENYRTYSYYLSGILGFPPQDLDMSSVEAFRSHYHKKIAINTAYMVPHGAVRLEAVGFKDSPMVGESLDRAKGLVRDGIDQGAAGFATGLSYHPQAWSDTEELVALCETVKEAGGVYVTHLRDVNTERAFGGGEIAEALEIGRRSGVKVHFSHHRTGESNVGKVEERLELIDRAKAEGVDVTLELYPYPAGSTFLLSFLPSYVHVGGPEAIKKRLKDPTERVRIEQELEENPRRSLDDIILSYLPNEKELEGISLSSLAKKRGVSLGKAVCDLLLEQNLTVGFLGTPPKNLGIWNRLNRDFVEFLSRPDYMVGSDSIHVGSLPHPRGYGAFPRFLGRFRRQFPVMTLEQMVQRMTDNPARRFGLVKRGRVETGCFADLVVFNPDEIIDTATYDDPRQYPTGIPYVIVNGQVAVDNGRCTGVFAGQAVP